LGQRAVVWYGAVLRGDRSAIAVGAESSIGDRVVVHGSVDRSVTVGQRVTVGQAAVLHGCTVGDGSVIGSSALVFGTVGKHAQVGAGAMVLENQTVPDGQLWDGRPAKFVRALTDEEKGAHATKAVGNVELAAKHREEHARSEAERQTRRDFLEFDRNSPATTLHEHPF
jgi:carbonic anhydrase/acetyltransferase-like protein (isoleucine patch superfamily)